METPKPVFPVHTRLAQALREKDVVYIDGNKVRLVNDAQRLRNNDGQVQLNVVLHSQTNFNKTFLYTVPSDRPYRVEH